MAARLLTLADRPIDRDNGFNLIRVTAAQTISSWHLVEILAPGRKVQFEMMLRSAA